MCNGFYFDFDNYKKNVNGGKKMVAIIGVLTEEEIEELKKIFVTKEDYDQLVLELKDILGEKKTEEEEETEEKPEKKETTLGSLRRKLKKK